jgi:hypothetical protein
MSLELGGLKIMNTRLGVKISYKIWSLLLELGTPKSNGVIIHML